jgi:hypothetical protein
MDRTRAAERRARLPSLSLAACLAALLAAPAPADGAEPWSDHDPAGESTRYAVGDFGFRAGAEYRAQWLTVDPISPNAESGRRVSWLEHRLRLDGTVDYRDKVSLVVSTDVLDGALWGDNGDLGTEPEPNAGVNVGAKAPNTARPCVRSRGGDVLDPEAYGYGLCEAELFRFRRLYGQVALPFGVLRVGRQAANLGAGVQNNDGEGRANRFGVARAGNYVDRILFATKPLEALKPKERRDTSPDRGLILALAYDRWVTDSVHLFGDDLNQTNLALVFREPRHALGTDLVASAYWAHRWDAQYTTRVNSVGARAMSRFGPIYAGIEGAMNVGSTREVAEAYRLITNDPAVDQDVRQLGARAVVRYDLTTRGQDPDRALLSAYLEADYASGDGDPNVRTPLTQFVFAEDTNVGLLLFEHVLAFQSARASAAGVEVLRRLGAKSFPAEAVNTRGSFTNAIAIFPQVDLRPHDDVLVRLGALFAWAAEPVIDPVASLQARDGLTIDDDLVNFAGGKPGSYYGTELDARVQYRFLEHFALDLEGAVLFPGDALLDENGDGVRSGLVQGRTTFFF